MRGTGIASYVGRYSDIRNNSNGSDNSERKLLLSELYDDASIFTSDNNADQIMLFKMLHELNPLTAGGNNDTTFIAFCIKLCLNKINSGNRRLLMDGHPITFLVESLYASGLQEANAVEDGERSNKILKLLDGEINVDRCVHSIAVIFSLLSDKLTVTARIYRHSLLRRSCDMLADVQRFDHRGFTIYLQCLMALSFEENSIVEEVTLLFNFFFKSLPDLMLPSFCNEIIRAIILAVQNCLAIETSLITLTRIGVILAKLLGIIPLPLFVDILEGSFLRSKHSRVRNSGIICIESILIKTSNKKNEKQNLQEEVRFQSQKQQYEDQLERAVKQMDQEEITAHSETAGDYSSCESERRPLLKETQATLDAALKCLLDAVMQDPNEAVRHRALLTLQNLPASIIRKREYRILILKCRDKAAKVRTTALTIIVDLSSHHARKTLNQEELNKTIRHLLLIDKINPISGIQGGEVFMKELVTGCFRLYPSPQKDSDRESRQSQFDGSDNKLQIGMTDGVINKKISEGDTVVRACESLQLHTFSIDKTWTILRESSEPGNII